MSHFILGAKPKAEIKYSLVSGGNKELERVLETLSGTEQASLILSPTPYYHGAEVKCEVIHETIMQDVDYETKWTKTIILDVRKNDQNLVSAG